MREGSDPWGTRTRVQRRLAMTITSNKRRVKLAPNRRSNLTTSRGPGGDRDHAPKLRWPTRIAACQGRSRVITLSLSNSFASDEL